MNLSVISCITTLLFLWGFQLFGQTISPSQLNLCEGDSLVIILDTSQYASTVTNLQWQFRVGAGPWTDLTNTPPFTGVTTDSLRINGVNSSLDGREYRVLIDTLGGPGFQDTSNMTDFNIYPPFVAGVIGSDQSLCYDSVPVPLSILTNPSGADGNFSYQWSL